MPFTKDGRWYPPDGWDDDWEKLYQQKKQQQAQQMVDTQPKQSTTKNNEKGPSVLQRIGNFLSGIGGKIGDAYSGLYKSIEQSSPIKREQLPSNYDSLSFGERARIASQILEQNRQQQIGRTPVLREIDETLGYIGQNAAQAIGLNDAMAFLQRTAGAKDAKPSDFMRDPSEAQYIPQWLAKGAQFAGSVAGTLPLAIGGGLTTGRAAANLASRLLQNAPRSVSRIGTSVAQGIGTGAFVGSAQQALGELGDPDAATLGERLREAAKTAGMFGLYGAAYPLAASAIARATQALPQSAQSAIRSFEQSRPITSSVIRGTTEGALAGGMVGAGFGAVDAAKTGDLTQILRGAIGESGQEAGENLVESIALGIARRLTGGFMPQVSAQTNAKYVPPQQVQAQSAGLPLPPGIVGSLPEPGQTSGRYAEGLRRTMNATQQPYGSEPIEAGPMSRYTQGVLRAREAAAQPSGEEVIYVQPDYLGGEAIVGRTAPPVPNVGDRVRLRGLSGEYTVTGARGFLVGLRGDDGKEYTVHVRSVVPVENAGRQQVESAGGQQETAEGGQLTIDSAIGQIPSEIADSTAQPVRQPTTQQQATTQTSQPTIQSQQDTQEQPPKTKTQGKVSRAKTERGTEVQTQFVVVDADSLITSHDTSLRTNPNFPQELQPRDRSRAASEQQVQRIAAKIEPEFLGESPKASEGAPIVGPDMIVESGNARTIAVKRAYERNMDSAKRYKDWLIKNAKRFGLDPETVKKMKNPVLVRVRQSNVDRLRFVQEANEQSVAAMSATEQAIMDANNLQTDLMDIFYVDETGNINNASNRDFIANFMHRVVGPAEMNRYVDKNERLSQEGLTRIRNAVFAKAYGDIHAIEKLAESTDNNVKNITNAMLMAAPRIAKIKDGIQSGRYYDLDITQDIAAAMNKLSELRDQGESVETYLRQIEMFEELSPLAKEILTVFDANKRSAKKINAILQAYADVVEAQGSPDQLGLFEFKPPTPSEAWAIAVKKAERDGGYVQTTIYQNETGRDDGDGTPPSQLGNQTAIPKAKAKAVGDSRSEKKREVKKDDNQPDDDNEKILSFALGQAYQKKKAKEGETKGEAFSWSGAVPNRGGTKYKLTPKASKEIADIMANALDTVLRTGPMQSKGSLGEFLMRAKAGRVRKQFLHNWRVVGHELGHAFSTQTNFEGDPKELEALGDRLYPRKIKDTKLKREEGLAEFFQLYFVDPKKAKQWAPNTVKEFESFIEENEILGNAVGRIRVIVENDLEGTPIERGMRTILPYGSKPKEEYIGEEYKMNTFKRALFNVVDFTIPFQDMMKEAAQKGYSGINVAKFVAMTGNAVEKARHNFESRATDHRGRYVAGEPLKKIADEAIKLIEQKMKSTGIKFKGFDGDTSSAFQVFDTILHAARYAERASRGHLNNPIDPQTANGIIKQAEELFPGIMDYVKRYTSTLSNIILTKLERAGVITSEARKRIEAGSTFYIPTYYATRPALSSATSEGRRTARNPVKRYDGKEQMTFDFLTSTMTKLAEVEQVIEYKRTIDAIEEALRLPEMGKFGVIERRPIRSVKVDSEQLVKKVEKLLNESISEAEIGSEAITIFLPGGLNDLNKKDPVIMNWHGDKQTYMRLSVDLFEALMAMGPIQTGAALRMLAKASSWFRYFSLTTPRYLTNALARDLFTSAIQKKAPGSIIKATFRGVALAAGIDPKIADQYVNSGAFFSSVENVLQSMSRASLTDGLLQTEAPGWKRTSKGIFYYVARGPGELLRIQEQIYRFAEFENAIKEAAKKHGIDPKAILDGSQELPKGMDKVVERILTDAAYAASEVTTNFNLRGASGFVRNVFPTVPFLHGTVQGLYREARQIKNNPGQTAFRIMMYLVPITMAAWWFMEQTGEDDDTPSEFRDKYWVFPLPIGGGTIENPRFRIAIAKPFTYAMPVNFMERFLDWATRETDVARKPFDDMGSLFGQTFGIRALPSIIAPFLAIYANKTDFGTPIVPRGEEMLAKELQYGPETSELAKMIAGLFNGLTDDPTKGVSPRQVDYIIKNIMGNLGRWVADATDKMLGKPGEAGAEYMPVIGSLLYGTAEGGSRIVDRFYADYQKAQTLNTTAKKWLENYAKTQKKPSVKLTEEQIRLVYAKPVFDTLADVMSQLRKGLKDMETDMTIDPKMKYEARIRAKYFEKVAAGLLYGYIPKIPPNSDITEEQVMMFIDQLNQVANERLQNSINREGGPQENAMILEFLSSLQQ